jgi:hypothetical protein
MLSSVGKYDEAEVIHRRALEQYKEVLGEKHPSTLTSMNNLAPNANWRKKKRS